jgi:hypothetical protein
MNPHKTTRIFPRFHLVSLRRYLAIAEVTGSLCLDDLILYGIAHKLAYGMDF